MTYTVYGLLDPNTNEYRYFGLTGVSVQSRFKAHCRAGAFKENPHKFRWIQSLAPLKPVLVSLYTGLTQSAACKKEIELISLYKTLYPKRLTNIEPGGQIPPLLLKERNPMYGAYGVLNPKSIRVKATKINTGEIVVFGSTREASRKIGCVQQNITSCLRGRQSSAKGWKFSYADKEQVAYQRKHRGETLKIKVKSTNPENGKTILFNSQKEAAEYFKVSASAICIALKKKTVSAGWKHEYENQKPQTAQRRRNSSKICKNS